MCDMTPLQKEPYKNEALLQKRPNVCDVHMCDVDICVQDACTCVT